MKKMIFCEATNLRRDLTNREIWRRVGMPAKQDLTTATVNDTITEALPIGRVTPFSDCRSIELLCSANNKLYYRVINTSEEDNSTTASAAVATSATATDATASTDAVISGGSVALGENVKYLGQLSGKPILVVGRREGLIILLIEHHPAQYLTYDKELSLTLCGEMPELPELQLVATDINTLYGAVAAVSLSGNSSGESGSQLCRADNQRLTDSLTTTYTALCRQAHELGYCVQPIIARYRLEDAAGNTVAVGPPVALSASAGFSTTDPTILTSTDSLQTINEGSMAMAVYRPAIVAPSALPAPWNRIISKAIIEVTAELDPVDSSLLAPHSIRCDNATGTITLSTRLPGFSIGMVINNNRFRSLALQAIAGRRYVVAEFCEPFNGGIATAGTKQTFQATSLTTASNNVANPATRSYRTATETAGITILCDPLTEPFYGWSPATFIASTNNSADSLWRLAFSVKLSTPAGDRWLKREIGSLTNAPESFQPILSYPSTDATELQISYSSSDGNYYIQSFPLTPIPDAGIACYFNQQLKPITLSESATLYQPKGTEQTATLSNGVAQLFASDDLGNLIDSIAPSSAPIYAIKAMPRGESGWDFSRRKILFFGEGGINLVTINNSGKFNTATTIDRRQILSAEAVCRSTGVSGASLTAIAGDDLIEISGQKVTTVKASLLRRIARREALTDIPATGVIGWNDRYHELYIALSNLLYRLTADGELIKAELPEIEASTISPYRFSVYEGRLLLSCKSGVYDLEDETAAESLDIQLRNRYSVTAKPENLTLNIFGTDLHGDLTLKGDRGTEIPEQLLRISIDGDLNAPLRLPLTLTPYRPWLETHISLAATSDLAILPPNF